MFPFASRFLSHPLPPEADVRCNESMNNLLKVLMDDAPNTGLPLLSARARIKKSMGIGYRNVSVRWSHLQPRAHSMLTEMQAHVREASQADDEIERFKDAPMIPVPEDALIDQKYLECNPSQRVTPESKWSAPFQVLLGRTPKQPSADVAIAVHDKPGMHHSSIRGGLHNVWICSAKNYSMCYLAELETEPGAKDEEIIARVKIPFNIRSSKELFLDYYNLVQVCRGRPRAVTLHNLEWFPEEVFAGEQKKNRLYAVVQK